MPIFKKKNKEQTPTEEATAISTLSSLLPEWNGSADSIESAIEAAATQHIDSAVAKSTEELNAAKSTISDLNAKVDESLSEIKALNDSNTDLKASIETQKTDFEAKLVKAQEVTDEAVSKKAQQLAASLGSGGKIEDTPEGTDDNKDVSAMSPKEKFIAASTAQ